jgi:hypothetical protein
MAKSKTASPFKYARGHVSVEKKVFLSAAADRARQFVSRCRWRLQFGNILKSFLMKSFRGGGGREERENFLAMSLGRQQDSEQTGMLAVGHLGLEFK